jgi:hypothetical protein
MLIFINKIISKVYSLIFGSDLPRVLEEMKKLITTKSTEHGRRLGVVHTIHCDLGIWIPGRTSSFTSFSNSQALCFGVDKTKNYLRD